MFVESQNVYMSEDRKDGFHLYLFWQTIDPRWRNWQDAREYTRKWTPHNFLACTFLVFNKDVLQAARRETRLQMLKIEQKHRMTPCTWGRGCPTKSVIDHRTWSITGHSAMINIENADEWQTTMCTWNEIFSYWFYWLITVIAVVS